MQKKKIFTIFLLFFGKYVFVGKTTSPRISAVYHRHARGKVYRTREHALKNPAPSLHILHVAEMHLHECYYWILAYIHALSSAGYQILNSPRTLSRANNLRAPAQSIVAEIEAEGIDQILNRTKVEQPSNADRRSTIATPVPSKRKVDSKVDIRLTEEEKARFICAAKKQGLTYREFLLSLLDRGPDNLEQATGQIVNSPTKTERLESNIKELQEKVHAQRVEFNKRLSDKNHRLQLVQAGLAKYYSLMRSASGIPLDIERGSYKDFPAAHEYCYPDKEGSYIMRPTALLYGKGKYPARFLLGIGDNQQRIKLRFYPNNQCVGVSLANPIFSKRGTVWLLGARRATDGAMDLAYAFPLDIIFRYNGSSEYGSEMNRFFADLFHEIDDYPK